MYISTISIHIYDTRNVSWRNFVCKYFKGYEPNRAAVPECRPATNPSHICKSLPYLKWTTPYRTRQSPPGTWSTSSDSNGALWQFFRTNLHFKGFVQRQPASERQRCFLPAFQGRGCADREAGWWLSCMETILKFPVGTIASDTVNECRVSSEAQRKAKHWALIIGALEKLCQRKVFFLRLFSLLLQLLFEFHSLSA